MNRILIGLAASAVILSSAGAFAAAKLDTDGKSPAQSGAMQLAQNNTGGSTGTGVGGTGSGGASEGNTQGGAGAMTPEEQKKKEMETKKTGATSGAAADTNADGSQSKRSGDEKPANSGSK
jgi:hypothetical protein